MREGGIPFDLACSLGNISPAKLSKFVVACRAHCLPHQCHFETLWVTSSVDPDSPDKQRLKPAGNYVQIGRWMVLSTDLTWRRINATCSISDRPTQLSARMH